MFSKIIARFKNRKKVKSMLFLGFKNSVPGTAWKIVKIIKGDHLLKNKMVKLIEFTGDLGKRRVSCIVELLEDVFFTREGVQKLLHMKKGTLVSIPKAKLRITTT